MYRRLLFLFFIILFLSCENYGKLDVLATLPIELEEVSGIEKIHNSDLIWMLNDSGNKPVIYGVDTNGVVIREVKVKAKNNDWEDITSDAQGNLYIADFGNNNNKRKNLSVLKIKYEDLISKDEVSVEKIKFSYPVQKKFPPKKRDRFFDAESLIFANNFLYFFTKSRVKNEYGKTTLYRIPASKGNYEATFISNFETCSDLHCWITAAAISPDKKKVVLLNHQSVYVLKYFKNDDFFSGSITELPLHHISQKESITFKDNNTVYITDEKAHLKGGRLYEVSLK
ncbi:MAG: hypothetical protein ACPGU6_02775 [Tenacibaculum sp.]